MIRPHKDMSIREDGFAMAIIVIPAILLMFIIHKGCQNEAQLRAHRRCLVALEKGVPEALVKELCKEEK